MTLSLYAGRQASCQLSLKYFFKQQETGYIHKEEQKMIKKWAALVLSLVMVTSVLAGCAPNESKVANAGEGDSGNEAVTIDIFQSKVEVVDQLQSLVDDFMEENPHITVNLDTSGGGEDYLSILKTRMNSGNQPSIFQIPGPTERDLWIDFLDDLSNQSWVDVTASGLLDNVTVDGKVLGQPVNIEGYGVMYNRSILEQAGVTDQMLANVDSLTDLRGVFEIVDSQKESLGLEAVLGWSVGGTAWWTAAYHTFNVPFAMQEDPMAFVQALNQDQENLADNDRMIAFKDLVDTFIEFSYDDVNVIDYEKQYTDFAIGKTAFMHQGNWTINQLNEIDEDLDIAFLPIAISDDADWGNDSIPVGVPNYWVVNAQMDENMKDASKLFLEYMAMSERGHKFMTEDAKYIPAFTNVNVEKSDLLAQSIIQYANDGKTIPWVWHAFPSGMNENDAKKAFQDYVSGAKDWNEILVFLDAKWDEKTK